MNAGILKTARHAVIGMGNWGTTIAELIAKAGHDVVVYARDKQQVDELNREHRNSKYTGEFILSEKLYGTSDIAAAVKDRQVLLLCVTCQSSRAVLKAMAPKVNGAQVIVHCIKGLELGTHKRVSEIIREETMLRQMGVLCGPNIAPEILRGAPAASVVASRYDHVITATQKSFKSDWFQLYGSTDVVGLELAGALKNILAIASGMLSELGYGVNTYAFLLTRGLAEIQRLGVLLGAQEGTFQGLAGMGDVIATCGSSMSRNFQVGRRLARGEKLQDIVDTLGMVAEGVKTTQAAWELAQKHGLEMPITEAVHRILSSEWTLQQALSDLMTRKAFTENRPSVH